MKIIIQEITKYYGSNKVLDHVSFEMEDQMIHCLLGASGAGKTTLLKLITGSLKSDSGTILIGDIKVPNRHLLHRIGFMPQEDGLYHELSIYDNLRFFAGIQGLRGADFQHRVQELLTMVQLSHEKDKLIANCSGGMKKRISLAVALIHNPDLLILDEPTVGIDPVLRRQIWNYLQALKVQGKTIIVTTHVMDEIRNCDSAALLRDGNLIIKDSIEHLQEIAPDHNIENLFFQTKEAT